MKKVLLFSILICLFLVQGCARWVKADFFPINPMPSGYVKNYTLGKTNTAFIGQEIIKVEVCECFQKRILSDQDIYITAKYFLKDFGIYHDNTNHRYPISGTVTFDGKTYYATKALGKRNQTWGILVSDDGSIYKSGLYSYDDQMMYIADFIIITPEKFVFLPDCVQEKPTTISYELLFTGKNDVSLNATYKEYSANELARPSFFQNLTYQPNAKQIRFKDFVIQIHNVTNEQITYTILEDGLK